MSVLNTSVSGGGESGAGLELVTGSIPGASVFSRYTISYLPENQIMEDITPSEAQQIKVVKGSVFYIYGAESAIGSKTVIGVDELFSSTIGISNAKYRFFAASEDFSIS